MPKYLLTLILAVGVAAGLFLTAQVSTAADRPNPDDWDKFVTVKADGWGEQNKWRRLRVTLKPEMRRSGWKIKQIYQAADKVYIEVGRD